MAEISLERAPAERELDGKRYILTKINYSKEAAEDDEAYHKERGREARTLEEDGFWLLYTKIGQ